MAWVLRDNEQLVESSELELEQLKALKDETRLEILESLAEKPSYPAELSKKLELPKQKAYYHFRVLQESGLIRKKEEVKKSGGLATIYEPASGALHLDLGGAPDGNSIGPIDDSVRHFLGPLLEDGEIDGFLVAGSPDEHGPDQVRGRDGHLAGEIGLKLGNYMNGSPPDIRLDTEVVRSEEFGENMFLIGGILTNSISRRYNDDFPASFEGESFPYRKLETGENEYTDARIGVIQRTNHPEDGEKQLFQVAGIQNDGTIAAARAFHDLAELFDEAETYVVLKGQDMDGDGEIDEYEVIEKG